MSDPHKHLSNKPNLTLENPVNSFVALWEAALREALERPPDVFEFVSDCSGYDAETLGTLLLKDQYFRWNNDCGFSALMVEEYLDRAPQLAVNEIAVARLVAEEYRYKRERDPSGISDPEEYLSRFPQICSRQLLRAMGFSDGQRLGRYSKIKDLARGGFAEVYLARNDTRGEEVVVKLVRPKHAENEGIKELFLKEAASLIAVQHPHIVPLKDFGVAEDGRFFLVFPYFQHGSIDQWRRSRNDQPPSYAESAQLVADVADALDEAHKAGIVHRDIKPANILIGEIDGRGPRAFLTDFGIALREEHLGQGPGRAGTIDYMSPEQAKGRSAEVTAQSDLFSLGIVLYELIAGRRPFVGDEDKVLDDIADCRAEPPSRWRDDVPSELNDICCQALRLDSKEKQLANAREIADALVKYLGNTQRSRFIPRGLKPFTKEDKDIYLEFIPREEEARLPSSIAFWKEKLEARDNTFRVGHIYGGCGCGKSSFLQAGLLPRLAEQVVVIRIEAHDKETELRLANALRDQFPDLPAEGSLAELLKHLLKGSQLAAENKLVIAIDQFEQWLHAQPDFASSELIEALKLCDGRRLQGLLLWRLEFLQSVDRFTEVLEEHHVDHQNKLLVKLIRKEQAEQFLREYGVESGHLSTGPGEKETRDQQAFLQQAADFLAIQEQVIPVQLALFAEIVQKAEWRPETIQAFEGPGGLALAFLRQKISGSEALPILRKHQTEVARLLLALLPDASITRKASQEEAELKGSAKSKQTLQVAARCTDRPELFDSLINQLCQLYIITGTDEDNAETPSTERFYQLTHDYLVPAVRAWTTEILERSREGLALLRLRQRTDAYWTAKTSRETNPRQNTENPDVHLPKSSEYREINRYTVKSEWTEPQSTMMRRAFWRSRLPAIVGRVAILLVCIGGPTGLVYLSTLLRQATKLGNDLQVAAGIAEEARSEAEVAATNAQESSAAAERHLRTLYARGVQAAADAIEAGRPTEECQRLLDDALPPQEFGDWRNFEWYYLRNCLHQELYFLAHADIAKTRHLERNGLMLFASLMFRPDGQQLALAGADGIVHLWDANSGDQLYELSQHEDVVLSVSFSPDGQRIASLDGSGKLYIWDANTRERLRVIPSEVGMNSVSFGPGGQKLVSAGLDGTVRLWDASSGDPIRVLPGHEGPVASVSFNPDGQQLVSAGVDGTVRLWDASSGNQLHELSGHEGQVVSVSFNPDGQQLVSAGLDGTVRLWDASSGDPIRVLPGHEGPVASVSFHPDGQQLASAGIDGTVRLWDATSGDELHVLRGHKDAVLAVSFSPDGQQLVSAGGDETVRMWDAESGEGLLIIGGSISPVYSVSCSPDGRKLVSAGSDGILRLWNANSGDEVLVLPGHEGEIFSIAFSSDSQHLASAGEDGTVRLWDAKSGDQIRVLPGHEGGVYSVAFSPDGQQLASAGEDGDVRLWDAASGDELFDYSWSIASCLTVSFSPDGKWLVSGSSDGTLSVWNAAEPNEALLVIYGPDGQELVSSVKAHLELSGHESDIRSVLFSPNGLLIASAGNDGTLRLWNAETGEELQVLRGHEGAVHSISFSLDGQRLASAGADETLRVWDAESGEQLLVLRGHRGTVHSVSFSPDGHRLLSGGSDGTLRVWDAVSETGDEQLVLRGPNGLRSSSFSTDGRRLASADNDGTLRLWDAESGDELLVLRGHKRDVSLLTLDPFGQRLATGNRDGALVLWNARLFDKQLELRGHKGEVTSLSFSPDGQRLASAGDDGTIGVWDTTTGDNLLVLSRFEKGVLNSVSFSPNGLMLATAGEDGTVYHWHVDSGDKSVVLEGHKGAALSVAYSQDELWMASTGKDGTIRLWSDEFNELFSVLQEHEGEVYSVAFSPDSHQIASAGEDGKVRLWETVSGDEFLVLQGHVGKVYSVAFSPDNHQIASAGEDGKVRLWDAEAGDDLFAMSGHEGVLFSVAFSPDSQRIASAGADGTVRLWDANSGDQIRVLPGHEGNVFSVAFSPDGQRIASAGADGTVRLWDVASGDELFSLQGHVGEVFSVSFNPDGQQLASCGSDGILRIWDAQSGDLLQQGHEWGLVSVSFSPNGRNLVSVRETGELQLWDSQPDDKFPVVPTDLGGAKCASFSQDGKHLATGRNDGTILLLDATSGKELLVIREHERSVQSVVFSPDGQRLISCDREGSLQFWDTATGERLLELPSSVDDPSSLWISADGKRIAARCEQGAVQIFDARQQDVSEATVRYFVRESIRKALVRESVIANIKNTKDISESFRQDAILLAEQLAYSAEELESWARLILDQQGSTPDELLRAMRYAKALVEAFPENNRYQDLLKAIESKNQVESAAPDANDEKRSD